MRKLHKLVPPSAPPWPAGHAGWTLQGCPHGPDLPWPQARFPSGGVSEVELTSAPSKRALLTLSLQFTEEGH